VGTCSDLEDFKIKFHFRNFWKTPSQSSAHQTYSQFTYIEHSAVALLSWQPAYQLDKLAVDYYEAETKIIFHPSNYTNKGLSRVFGISRGKEKMWESFVGFARKTPPHTHPFTAIPKELLSMWIGVKMICVKIVLEKIV